MVKNCAFSSLRSQFFTKQTNPKTVNNQFIFSSLSQITFIIVDLFTHTLYAAYVTVVRDWT